jgi:cobalt-zinc-cadmium efflux system outer membrane protein
MTRRGFWSGLALAGACCLVPATGEADQPSPCGTLTRANVTRCAVGASLGVKSEQLALRSFEGRQRAAGVLLPSNPTVTVSGGHSIEPTVPASMREPLWTFSVSQEVEIAGQRGKRVDVVSAEQRVQSARLDLTRRAAAADAWLLYFDALAAGEESRLAERLAALSTALTTAARARAQAGLAADVEAQLAQAAASRLLQARVAAQSRLATASASLASAVGLDPAVASLHVQGDLSPLKVAGAGGPAFVTDAVERRSEITSAIAEFDAQNSRVALYERLRVPNPTVSLFVRNDWINERQIGVGVAIPIPIPAPVGRTYAGEIAEASALAARAGNEAERLRRAVRLEIAQALQTFDARQKQADLYQPAQARQTEDTLRSIAEEIVARRLPIRDALLTQQALIDYLFADVEARRQLCFASVQLARAAGLSLEEGAK